MSRPQSVAFHLGLVCLLLISCSGRQNHEDRYYYDSQFRLTEYRSSDNQRFQLRYDSGGRVSDVQGPHGKAQFTYDARGHCIWRQVLGQTEHLYYDAFDRLEALASERGRRLLITTIEYDWRGHPVRVEILDGERMKENPELRPLADSLGRTGAGTIADWGNRERQTLRALEDLRARPGDERRLWTVYSAGYSYDLTGRIAAIQSPWGVIRYSYRPEASEAVRTLPDGVRSVFRFLPDGRLLSLRHEKDGGLLREYSYEYAVEGPVSRWTERSGDGHVQSHAETGAEGSPDEPITLATVDSDGAPRRFNLYGERLLASWTASGDVRFFLEDGFGRLRDSLDRSGRMEPFVPAAVRRAAPRVGDAFLSPASHDVFVGGIEVKPGELSAISRQYGMDTIGTSDVGATCLPEWAERTQDVFRAFLNYMGVPGGKTQVLNGLRNSFARNPSEPLTIRAHSNGAITIYQMREALARDIKEGRVKVREIVIAGAGVAKSLSAYFVGHGVNVPVREEDPANRLHDIIRVLTTPLQELGQEVSSPFLDPGSRGALVKYAAGVIALLGPKSDEEIVGLKHHSIPENYPGLLPVVARAGGAAARFDYRTDPFIGVRQELGGVKLDASGGADWKFGELVGVVYDPAKHALVFLGRRKQSRISASMADFTVALRLARASEEARFTLDPADPKNVRGPWLRAIHFPAEILSGTAFGETMFQADWLLKQYSFHTVVHEDGSQTERHVGVPGFKSVRDLSFEMDSPRDSNDRWSRFWIEVERQKIPTEDDAGIELIEDPRMVIKACRTVPDPSSPQGIRDICDVKDPINTAFIALFTKLYDQIAVESPEFARLKELAKLVVAAKWAVKAGIAGFDGQGQAAVRTTAKATALKMRWQRSTQQPYGKGDVHGIQTTTHIVELFGGVNLSVNGETRGTSPEVRSLRAAVADRLNAPGASPVFSVPYRGEPLIGAAMPVDGNVGNSWSNFASGPDGQVYYETANVKGSRRVRRRISLDGNEEEYEYDAANQLTRISSHGPNGWTTVGERAGGRSIWTTTTAHGNTFRDTYDAQGRLIETEVDGKPLAGYSFDAAHNRVTARYQHGQEEITYDSAGRVREYRVRGTDEAGEEAVLLEYSAENRITRISGPGNQQVRIGYDKQGTLPVALSGPAGQATFTYDDSGRPLTETFADGTVLSFTWAGSELEKVDWSRPGASAEERYGPNGVLSTRFSDGRTVTYGYTPQGLPSSVRDSRGDTRFEYDANRDLIGIRRPGGVTERVEHTRQGEIDVFSGRPSIRGPEIQFPKSHVPLAAPADI